MKPRLLIAGCGYLGSRLATMLSNQWQIYGLRRNGQALPNMIQPLVADLAAPSLIHLLAGYAFDAVIVCVAADQRSAVGYRHSYVATLTNLLAVLRQTSPKLQRLIFTSSTAVYGANDGRWVDEQSPTEPLDFRGEIMLEAEAVLQAASPHACIVRLAGIYGPQRYRLLDMVRRGGCHPPAAAHYSNRIHQEDAAGIVAYLLHAVQPPALCNGVDCEPADERLVMAYLEQLVHQRLPPPCPSSMSVPAPASGKRVRNQLVLAAGYHFVFPSYREGYRAAVQG